MHNGSGFSERPVVLVIHGFVGVAAIVFCCGGYNFFVFPDLTWACGLFSLFVSDMIICPFLDLGQFKKCVI